jgi:hypothetical protein
VAAAVGGGRRPEGGEDQEAMSDENGRRRSERNPHRHHEELGCGACVTCLNKEVERLQHAIAIAKAQRDGARTAAAMNLKERDKMWLALKKCRAYIHGNVTLREAEEALEAALSLVKIHERA